VEYDYFLQESNIVSAIIGDNRNEAISIDAAGKHGYHIQGAIYYIRKGVLLSLFRLPEE
jgi:hypothetical protein